MDIQTLRKMRSNDFGSISNAFEKIANPSNESKGYADDRFWKLEGDKAGNGTATIRFLPRVEGDELPWVRVFSHGFQGPTGKWYIENSLTTLGEQDPVSELNTTLWNSGVEANKKIAQNQKRRLSYIANVLIVSDPKHPENEGKVMLFKFGKKIFDKIMDKARPTFEDEKPVNVFDFWEGANFKLRMRKKDGFTNYDESAFQEPSALGDDDKIVSVAQAQHKLSEFLDRKNFKSYDELKRKLDEVLSGNGFNAKSAAEMADDQPASMEAPEPAKAAPAFTPKASAKPSMDEDDEDVMSYFEKIAKED
jgi:hypothetical protein